MGLGDVWYKTKVYFGLAEDDDLYEDDEDGTLAEEDLEQRYRRRPNVRPLDARRGRGEVQVDDIFSEDTAATGGGSSSRRLRDAGAQTSVLRATEAPADDVPKVYLSVPRTFNDAQQIGDRYKRGIPVIINLQTVEPGLAKRLIDFASGLTYALEGGMQRIADKVFLLTPENVELSAEDQARYLDAGFFNQAQPGGRQMLTLEELGADVESGAVDTVILAMTDMQGRLQGKRLSARAFAEGIAEHGAEGCNYLLAVDVDMNPVAGYAMSSWERGYGDFVFMPDLATLRRIPWLEGTVMVQCDLLWHDGSPVAASPRQVLRRQLERIAERGWHAYAGSELEFILFAETYESARAKRWRELRPANAYNVDYSILGTTMVEPVLRAIRLGMAGAGMLVEDSKGECNFGQHEVNFRYQEALRMADDHVVYRNGAKEIAFLHGQALTFMPKYDEREGNSCHIHLSLWEGDASLFPAASGHDMSETFRRFIAGLQRHTRELTLLLAPNVNSYKRFVRGSFAPTALVWGHDNRTCALRVVGHGPGMRVESRVAGGDVNPYLAFAALLAAGLAGIDGEYELGPAWEGSGYEARDEPHVPSTLLEARDLFAASALAREALGDEVVDHYVNAATVELDAFDAAVTDWELQRSFERL